MPSTCHSTNFEENTRSLYRKQKTIRNILDILVGDWTLVPWTVMLPSYPNREIWSPSVLSLPWITSCTFLLPTCACIKRFFPEFPTSCRGLHWIRKNKFGLNIGYRVQLKHPLRTLTSLSKQFIDTMYRIFFNRTTKCFWLTTLPLS